VSIQPAKIGVERSDCHIVISELAVLGDGHATDRIGGDDLAVYGSAAVFRSNWPRSSLYSTKIR
jgi:hypothetical protein